MMSSTGTRLAAGAAALALLAGLALGVAFAQTGAPNEEAIGRLVRRYILQHPDIITEAIERQRIEPIRTAIETPFAGAWAGNPSGHVTLVVFTDYNCPYCRASVPDIERLAASDPNLKIVWREMPVLGPASEAAATAALAAAKQGKYRAFHHALFSGGHPTENAIADAAKVAGLDPRMFASDRKAGDVAAEIATNLSLARRLEIGGTPYFVIGNRSYEGAIGYEALRAAVAQAHKRAE